eukprot:snap_masked-scaffold_5-processed-gene-12.17-mRNA-1 protein AED:1.00 eAED:1.00 QI:0/0/0/0/1/1/2/0/113
MKPFPAVGSTLPTPYRDLSPSKRRDRRVDALNRYNDTTAVRQLNAMQAGVPEKQLAYHVTLAQPYTPPLVPVSRHIISSVETETSSPKTKHKEVLLIFTLLIAFVTVFFGLIL